MHDTCKPFPAFTLIAALILTSWSISRADDSVTDSALDHISRANIALQDDDYLTAVKEYRAAAELSEGGDIARQATRLAFNFSFNDEALRAVNRWRELEPENNEALIHLAQIQLRLGNVRDARRSFRLLMERNDRPPDEQLFALMSFISQEDPEHADELMRSLAKPYEDSALAHYAVAAVALRAEELEFAMQRAQRAIELDPDWVKAKLLYARALLLSGERDAAIDYTARIIGDDPNPDPDARVELALLYMSAGRDDDALSQVNQVLLERPRRADALRMMAIINFRLNNLDVAWDDFEDLLESREYTEDALYYLARIADIRAEVDRAIRFYSEVKVGSNAVASQRRAAALIAHQKEDPEKALQNLDEFADSNPSRAIDVVLVRAQLLDSLDRRSEALDHYDKILEYRPNDEFIALGRAELLLRMDRLDDSLQAYREAARVFPDSSMTLNALGYTLADRTDQYREAERLIRKALKYDPENPAIIDSFGWVLHKRGKYDAALEQLEVAYERFPDHEVAAHLVEVLVTLERIDEASELLAAAEEKTPDSELLKDVRERLLLKTP